MEIHPAILKIKIKSFVNRKKSIFKKVIFPFDLLFTPITVISLCWLKFLRSIGIQYLKATSKLCEFIGIFPIRDHYYEPLYNHKLLSKSLRENRNLRGIDFNDIEQLDLLKKFNYNHELEKFPVTKKKIKEFAYDGGSFPRGDSVYLYSMIRLFKPGKIIEIGSGQSTLMAINAINQNSLEDASYKCELICIEPYKQSWLEDLNVTVIRDKVENIKIVFFKTLKKNDFLFIDSTHMIRPQGDVLYEILEILPELNSGVFIHFHDIFTPKDYPDDWIIKQKVFWNEQYLLEAFLSYNSNFKIIGALNYLIHQYPEQLFEKCPILKLKKDSITIGTGSFWIQKKD